MTQPHRHIYVRMEFRFPWISNAAENQFQPSGKWFLGDSLWNKNSLFAWKIITSGKAKILFREIIVTQMRPTSEFSEKKWESLSFQYDHAWFGISHSII